MKYLSKLSLIILLFFVAASCSDDDDGNVTSNQAEIVGTWTLFETRFVSSNDDTGPTDETFSADSCNSPVSFIFDSDGQLTLTDVEFDFDEDFDGNLIFNCQVSDAQLNGSWQLVSGNSYVVTIEGEAETVDINFLNNNTIMEFIIINDQSDDPTDPSTQEFTLRFNKN